MFVDHVYVYFLYISSYLCLLTVFFFITCRCTGFDNLVVTHDWIAFMPI